MKVSKTYLDPKWEPDPTNPKILFNVAKTYKILLEGGMHSQPGVRQRFFKCPHCGCVLFYISKLNPDLWKCETCSSLIKTNEGN